MNPVSTMIIMISSESDLKTHAQVNPVSTMIIMIPSESDLKTHAQVDFLNESYIPQ